MSISEERKLYATKNWVIFILLYYTSLFLICITISTNYLVNLSEFDKGSSTNFFKVALLGSISIAISASTIAYIRKLYKLCFSYSSSQENDDQLKLKQLGTVFYFLTRPLYAIAFATLIVIALRSGMVAASKNIEFDEGFVYVSMFFSFYAGFLSGEAIKSIEKHGKNKINKVIN